MTTEILNRPLAAMAHMLGAMFVIGFIDNFIAVLSETIGLWQFQVLRSAIGLPSLAILAWLGFGSFRVISYRAVALRSLLIAIAMLFYFGALAFVPIAQALAGLFTSPIFILLITAFILRRAIGPVRILAVAIGFLGVVLVLDPNWSALNALIFLPVLGGLFYGAGSVATREMCMQENTFAMLAGLFLCQMLIGFIALAGLEIWAPVAGEGSDGFLLRRWTWEFGPALPWVVLQAVGSLLGVGLIIRAYQMAEPSYVSIFEYSIFLFGPFFGWILTGQGVSLWQAAGIVLVSSAGVLIALRSR